MIRVGTPLPPICVFCGDPATATTRTAIETRGHPIVNLQLMGTRIPVCEHDRRTQRSQLFWLNFAVVVGFVTVLLTGRLPGLQGLLLDVLNPFGGRLPGMRVVILTIAFFVVGALIRRYLAEHHGPAPRPLRLKYAGSGGGFIWLHGADVRYLLQLPPIRPAPPPFHQR